MAKIDIKFAQTDLVRTSGLPEVQPTDFSGISDIAATVAKHEFDKINKKKELEQLAIDSNYNANTTIALNNEIIAAQERHKQSLFDAPDQYQAAVLADLKPIMDNAINSAPSIKAKIAMQNQVAQMTIHTGIKTSNDTSEARVAKYRSDVDTNMDALSSQVFNNPESIEEAKLTRLKMLEAFKTVARSPQEYLAVEQATSERLDLVFLQGASSKFPEDAIKLVKSGKFNHLGAEDLTKIEYAAHQKIDTNLREAERVKEEARQEIVLGYRSEIAKTRDLNTADKLIREVLSKEEVLGKEFPTILEKVYNEYDRLKAKQEDVVRVATFTEQGVHLSPDNPKDLKRIETVFDSQRDRYNKMDVGTKANFVKGWLDQYGILPPSVATGLIDSVRNGNPDNKAKAAVLLNDLLDSDERIMRQFGGKHQDVALASRIARNLTYGMDAKVAVESAETDIFKGVSLETAKDPRRQARIKLYNSSKTDIGLGDFTSFWKDDPESIPAEMLAEAEDYKRILAINYGESEDDAHRKAVAKTKANWGYSAINGELKFTRNPVEKLYGGGKDTSWMRKQLESEVGAAGAMIDKTKISPPELKLTPIADHLSKTGTAEYLVTHPDAQGFPTPVLRKDEKRGLVPFVWKPLLVQTESYQKARGISKERLTEMNESANSRMLDRYRAKLVDNALKNESISPETRKRIKDDQRNAYKSKVSPNLTTEDLENLDDIKPIKIEK
jgi:hypothetical protein